MVEEDVTSHAETPAKQEHFTEGQLGIQRQNTPLNFGQLFRFKNRNGHHGEKPYDPLLMIPIRKDQVISTAVRPCHVQSSGRKVGPIADRLKIRLDIITTKQKPWCLAHSITSLRNKLNVRKPISPIGSTNLSPKRDRPNQSLPDLVSEKTNRGQKLLA